MAIKKQKTNLFSGGLLANAITKAPLDQEEEVQEATSQHLLKEQPDIGEEDDPLFGNTKRILDITQKVTSITDASTYPKIVIEKLENNPYQPRRRMNQKRLEALAHEIQTYGFKGVLLARVHPTDNQRYQLVYGHRRREASKLAGLTELPVMIDNTISDDEMKFLAVNENVLRDDLTPLDEAYAYVSMLEEMSQDAIAARLGVSRGYIRNRTDILKAPEDVQDMVEEKPDTMKAVVYLKDVQEDDIRKTAIQALMSEGITINQTKVFIENLRKAKASSQAIVTKEEISASSQEQNEATSQQAVQNKTSIAESVPQTSAEKELPKKSEVIQQSKEQTEALTDKTKIETFTKYLQKYDQRLNNRAMTGDEKVVMSRLIDVARDLLEHHP